MVIDVVRLISMFEELVSKETRSDEFFETDKGTGFYFKGLLIELENLDDGIIHIGDNSFNVDAYSEKELINIVVTEVSDLIKGRTHSSDYVPECVCDLDHHVETLANQYAETRNMKYVPDTAIFPTRSQKTLPNDVSRDIFHVPLKADFINDTGEDVEIETFIISFHCPFCGGRRV